MLKRLIAFFFDRGIHTVNVQLPKPRPRARGGRVGRWAPGEIIEYDARLRANRPQAAFLLKGITA